MSTNAQLALSASDILHHIILAVLPFRYDRFLQAKYVHPLALVSRSFFWATIPLVWENVGAGALLYLLPSVQICLERRNMTGRELKMKLEEFKPESWTDAEFTRVDFYGPLVKAVSLRNTWHYRRSNLDQYQLVDAILTSPLGNLIRQYLRDHTIFPNLQTIWGLCNGGYELHPAIDWELHLAPTSLHELDVGLLFSRRDGKKQDENLFIEAVLKRCPGLEVLKLHAADSSIDIDEWCDIFTDFSLLQRLYELRVSGELVCQSMFEWVSKLPSLQILEIGAASCHNLWLSLQELEPKNGRSIELIQLNTVTTLKVEWDLSDQIALLPKYCSSPHLLALSLDDAYLLWSPKKHSFASLISCQSPKIKKLTIGATADSGLVRAERLSLTQWFDGFRLLDLSELHIAIALDVSDKTYFQELNDRIANYWPRLEYLSWESQTFTFQEVAEIISHFPHIASLSFKTMRDPWIRPTNILPSISTQPLKLYCHLADCCDIDADAVVGWLKEIRPIIHYEIYPPPRD